MAYFRTCPHCGSHLDAGEFCDCIPSLYSGLNTDDRRAVDNFVRELVAKKKAAHGATNTTDGTAEQTLSGTVSASTITENGGFVK